MKNKIVSDVEYPCCCAVYCKYFKPVPVGEAGSSVSSPNSPPCEPPLPDGAGPAADAGERRGSISSKHRLQRQMAQSRKTFRIRRSKYGRGEVRQSHFTSVQITDRI